MDTQEISESRFQFDEDAHLYTLDQKPLTGVTTVLRVLAKPALIPWASKMACEHIKEFGERDEEGGYYITPEILEQAQKAHTQKKEAAGEHGTDTHAIAEKYIRLMIDDQSGKPCEMNDDPTHYWKPIEKFIAWARENVQEFLCTERMMYNEQFWFAGTMDFSYVEKDGKRYVADLKTSSGIWDEMWYQVAAYRFLAESMGDEPYDGQVIVRLGKDGKFEVKKTVEYTLFKDAFFHCLGLYRAQAKIAGFITNTSTIKL